MDRVDKDMLVVDMIAHGSPAVYTIARLIGVDIRNEAGNDR